MAVGVCVFDAYGTLFDVGAAARQLAEEDGQEAFAAVWTDVAETWRQKQLQYSWIRALAGAYTDFWTVTQEGLDFALEAHGMANDQELRERLLALYWALAAYPEVPDMLASLKKTGLQTAILSNGSPEMLEGAVKSAGLSSSLDAVLSVEEVRIFKPDRRVYDLVGQRFGVTPAEVLFVSSNGWDAAASAGYGFQTAWVNRRDEPLDRLPWTPQTVLRDLAGIPDLAVRL